MASVTNALFSSNSAPKNVAQVVAVAKEYEFNAQVPLKYWLRTANALLKQAGSYLRDGDDEAVYLLLFRHAHLMLTNLSTHPEAKQEDYKKELKRIDKDVQKNLETLDILKPRINKRYDEYAKALRERNVRRESINRRQTRDVDSSSPRDVGPMSTQQLRGHENKDVAVRLAQQEFARRLSTRQRAGDFPARQEDNTDLSGRLQVLRAQVTRGEEPNKFQQTKEQMPSRAKQDGEYNYPRVPGAQPSRAFEVTATSLGRTEALQPLRSPPLLPPKSETGQFQPPPSLPPKPSLHQQQLPVPSQTEAPARPAKVTEPASLTPAPVSKKSTADQTLAFAATAQLENGSPLRSIFLPPTLRTTFLRIAHQNTLKNVETCGFLAGTLMANALFVSQLIVPAQTATSDTCEMTNESQLFDYVDSHDLMIVGWIHTHPSQTCFMSSRDLHTHAGYQMMLAESIAIVCAPSKGDTTHGGDWGVYRLTDPPGKMAILQCEKPGIFHPHDVDNIYTDAMRPGHVVEAKGMDFEVIDLRNAS